MIKANNCLHQIRKGNWQLSFYIVCKLVISSKSVQMRPTLLICFAHYSMRGKAGPRSILTWFPYTARLAGTLSCAGPCTDQLVTNWNGRTGPRQPRHQLSSSIQPSHHKPCQATLPLVKLELPIIKCSVTNCDLCL